MAETASHVFLLRVQLCNSLNPSRRQLGVNGISTGASLRDNAVDHPDFYQDVNVMRSTSWDKVGFVIPPVPGDSQPARASRFTPSAFAYRPCSGQAPRPQHLEEEYL